MTARSRGASTGPDAEGFDREADLVRVLAHPKRLMIVDLLGDRSATVTEIADWLGLSLQNTSQHLRVMRDRGVVVPRRDGREVRYALVNPVLAESCRLVRRALRGEVRPPRVRVASGRAAADGPRAGRDAELGRVRRPIPIPG